MMNKLDLLVIIALMAMFLLAEFLPAPRRIVRPIEKPQFREYRSTSNQTQ